MSGHVRGYQYGYPYAFYCNLNNYNCFYPEIKTYGVTLTYSNIPRKHIWTYAGGNFKQGTGSYHSPCNNGSQYQNHDIPFVGNDYYCESGRTVGEGRSILYTGGPLWDGQDCLGLEATCCTSSKMPWFVKILHETVSEDIELTTCGWNYNYLTYMLKEFLLTLLNFTLNNNPYIHILLKLPHTFTQLQNNYNHLNSNTVLP